MFKNKSNQYCLASLFILFVLLQAQDNRDVAMTSGVGLLGILGTVSRLLSRIVNDGDICLDRRPLE